MEKTWLDDEKFIKKEYNTHKKLISKHLSDVENIKDYHSVWSNNYLDFVPYEWFIDYGQKKPPKIFKTEPNGKIMNKIENRYKDNLLYYSNWINSNDVENKFKMFRIYLYNQNYRIRLSYDTPDLDLGIILNYIEYYFLDGNNVQKVLYFNKDNDMGDIFFISEYKYDGENRIKSIIKNGYYYGVKNIIPESIVRFEYTNGKATIFHKQLKLNGDFMEEIIFQEK